MCLPVIAKRFLRPARATNALLLYFLLLMATNPSTSCWLCSVPFGYFLPSSIHPRHKRLKQHPSMLHSPAIMKIHPKCSGTSSMASDVYECAWLHATRFPQGLQI